MAPGLAASTEASQPPLKNPTIVVKTSLLTTSVYAISMGLLYYHRKWFATWYHTVTKSCDGSIQEMALVNEMISSTRHNKNEYVQPVTCSTKLMFTPISPYLHTRGQRNQNLGSWRVSKHVLGNPRFGHMVKRSTQQLIMWVSMMQIEISLEAFLKRITQEEGRVIPLVKSQWSPKSTVKLPR
jgi:hypothetical protein